MPKIAFMIRISGDHDVSLKRTDYYFTVALGKKPGRLFLYQNGYLAQSVERPAVNRKDIGSSPIISASSSKNRHLWERKKERRKEMKVRFKTV